MTSPLSFEEQLKLAESLSDEELQQIAGDQQQEVSQDQQIQMASELSDEELKQIINDGSPSGLGIDRALAQGLRGLGEGAAGLPAQFRDIAKGLDSFTKKNLPQPPAFLQGSGDNFVKKFLRDLIEKAPTSEQIRESSSQKDPRTVPRNLFEKVVRKGGEFAGGSIPFGASQIIPAFAGGASSEAIKEAGGGALLQFAGSVVGGLTAGKLQSFVKNPRAVKKFSDKLFDGMRENIKKGETVDGRQLRESLTDVINDIEKGLVDSTQKAPRNIAQRILRKVDSTGEIELDSLEKIYRNINNELTEFAIAPNKKRLLNQVKSKVSDAIQGHAGENPEFVDLFNKSNEAFSALQNSTIFNKALPRGFKLNSFTPESLVLFGLFPPSLATVGKVAVANQLIQITSRITQSPVLRRFYGELLKEAAEGNKGNVLQAMKNMDEALRNESESGVGIGG